MFKLAAGNVASALNIRRYNGSNLNAVRAATKPIKQNVRNFLLGIGLSLALNNVPAQTPDTNTAAPVAMVHLSPGLDDKPIAQLTARMLQQVHYRQQKFDDTISSNLLARFINDLDPQHVHFLQSDLADFSRYSFLLGDLTLRYGDTLPAYEVYNRFFERLAQRTAYAENLLKTEKFTFDADERVTVNRHDLPYPKDLAEAQKLWHDRVRFEYLQEKLNAEAPGKLSETIGKTNGANAAIKLPTGTNSLVKITTNTPAVKPPRTLPQIHDDIVKTLTKRYERVLTMFKDWDNGDVLQLYLTTLAHVYDPHSDYMGKSQLQDFSMSMNLSLFGIGAVLTTDDDGYCKIKEVKPGPAFKSGKVKAEDRIVSVAQGTNEPVDVVNMPLNKVVQLIRGPKNTEVRLTIWPANATDPSQRKVVALVRDEIKLEDSAAKAKLIELPDGKGGQTRLGVIQLPSFYAPIDIVSSKDKATARFTTADVTKLLVKLAEEKVGGVILDLRYNGGGSLDEAIKLTGLFIKQGPVVQVRDSNGDVTVDKDNDPAELYDGPLIVLVSRYSASASEIFAGALQDYGRAVIVGDTSTHGKGTVQTLTQIAPYLRNLNTTNDPGALKVTIRKFYRPSGSSTQLKGVASDIVLPSIENLREDIGETALEGPLPWDTIPSSEYDHMNRVAPVIDELRHRSELRVAAEKDFAYVREDMANYKKIMTDKTVSLNEAQRLKEMTEGVDRKQARDRERLARKTPEPKIYEINLAQAELPGLPPPVTKTNTMAAVTGDAPDSVEEEKAPAIDVELNETERIMVDYLSLLPVNKVAVANPVAN